MVITNAQLCKDWIRMALSDWESVISHFQLDADKYKGQIVYHIQQFVEKIAKGIISLFGEEPRFTHFPTEQLIKIMNETPLEIEGVERERWIGLIKRILVLAEPIEDEGTKPRYGVRLIDQIISPNEYYSIRIVRGYLYNARKISSTLGEFLALLPFSSLFKQEITLLQQQEMEKNEKPREEEE
jgi:HEPN domain-containing protein